jgi:hypothetical protein
MPSSLVRLVGVTYGPYAFGLISLLVVWYAIVAPTLNTNRVDVDAFRQVSTQLRDTAASVAQSAKLVNDAVAKMDALAEKWNRASGAVPNLLR